MRQLLIIGIGPGDADYVTMQAVKALNRVDVFFVVDKGQEKDDLVQLRREICERYIEGRAYRVVEIPDPVRDRRPADYQATVRAWRQQRADRYEQALRDELGEDQCGAFLVWGDPALYDSTIQIVEEIIGRGNVALEYEVIPGISAVQALVAKHKITLNRVGEAIQITTGRRLAQGLPQGAENVVVMLDAGCTFKQVAEPGLEIYWGAYLGTEDEILRSGEVLEVMDEIEQVRGEARTRKGWIMDTYLLRRKQDKGLGQD
jgi:precorrin-6A synthase